MDVKASQTGRAAVAAGVLMAAGVEGEWLLNPQRDDGAVTDKPGFALLVATSTIGFVLLCVAIRRLRTETVRRTRPARVGSMLCLVGAGLLVAFGALVLGSGLASGSPLEASFLAFALGLLLLSIGQVMWGLSLRHPSNPSSSRGVWQALVAAGVLAFGSIAIPVDPWHDVSLVALFVAWVAIGLLLLRSTASDPAAPRGSLRSPV